jgi:uncharacterized protein (DUF2126 family)/transglutaminase-like putative cysteine protease
MALHIALHHRTSYTYGREIFLGAQTVRLKPAPHCRTPILSYALKAEPADHFIHWQQDPQGNYCARLVFSKPARSFSVEVDLIAEMTALNPFDFFLEPGAETAPFTYEPSLASELSPFLRTGAGSPAFDAFLRSVDVTPRSTLDFLVALNMRVSRAVRYVTRLEHGVQSPEETLTLGNGSCRDSAWLLVQVLRHLRIAARFVSGYLIQLRPDVRTADNPAVAAHDVADLHAWCEVYLPGAGWIGVDPTSGLLAGEGHIPLACTPEPAGAAPITGAIEKCESTFGFEMTVRRILETPRVTLPYSDPDWAAIDAVGLQVDGLLRDQDVRLTIGGEPTFIAAKEMDAPEWNVAALGERKRAYAGQLFTRVFAEFGKGGIAHFGQGKWYPGEPLPRWVLACYWRKDGTPLWGNPRLLADPSVPAASSRDEARRFTAGLAGRLGISEERLVAGFEDTLYAVWKERRIPAGHDPNEVGLSDKMERDRLAAVLEAGVGVPVGYALPVAPGADGSWTSSPWHFVAGRMFLVPGNSPMGLRMPLSLQPWRIPGSVGAKTETEVRIALCVEPRAGHLHVFMPPLDRFRDYLALLGVVEATAASLGTPVILEGYPPPDDPVLDNIKVTPDPGVIEVNINPSANWPELSRKIHWLYEAARDCGLCAEKFLVDGRHVGTGGGNHVIVGGPTPADSPILRRPHLLKSLLAYWHQHPALSYVFSGLFIGPTSQSPRIDEARNDSLYELEVAFLELDRQLARTGDGPGVCPPWLVDRIFRNLLVDITGNTHRAEFCIDKLYSPEGQMGRLGLLEFRAIEMTPHPRMSLVQQLLLRALVARFWEHPFSPPRLTRWGTQLHDRFMLHHFLCVDLADVVADLQAWGLPFEERWFAPHLEFRLPVLGRVRCREMELELRQALEPWHVMGEENAGGIVRFVDSSVERLQVKLSGPSPERYIVACNGTRIPLFSTGTAAGDAVAGVRYRAWQPSSALHPTIGVDSPLVFDLVDTWNGRSVGGCTYHVTHPGGRSYSQMPVNAREAEARRLARFLAGSCTPGPMKPIKERALFPEFSYTVDLRLADKPKAALG